MGGQQLQFALGQHRALDLWMLRVMQAQAYIGFMQQQAVDDLASGLARQVARHILEASTQRGNALGQQLVGKRRRAEGAQGRSMMVFQAAGKALQRLQGFIQSCDLCLQLQGFPRWPASARARWRTA